MTTNKPSENHPWRLEKSADARKTILRKLRTNYLARQWYAKNREFVLEKIRERKKSNNRVDSITAS